MRIVSARAFLSIAIAAVVTLGATCAVAQTASTGSEPALSPSKGQAYPSKPIRIIAGQAPGGATDLFARMFGQKLNEAWKNPVVVENRPGAAGTIATEIIQDESRRENDARAVQGRGPGRGGAGCRRNQRMPA